MVKKSQLTELNLFLECFFFSLCKNIAFFLARLTVQFRIRLPVIYIHCPKLDNIKKVLHCDMCSLNLLLYNNSGVRKFSCFFGQPVALKHRNVHAFNTIEKVHGNFHVPCHMSH